MSWGKPTCKLVQLIVHALQLESYNKIMMGVREIATKTCRTIHTDEVIYLTADKLPAEFVMVINNSSDNDDGNVNGYENENSGDKIGIEDQDDIKIKDGEEKIKIKIEEQDEEQDAMEDEYEEENNLAIYVDDEDEGNQAYPSSTS